MRKNRIVVALLLAAVLCILAGCSADALMGTGKTMGKLSSAGTGHGGDRYVDEATSSVESFIERYESLLDWDRWAQEGGKRSVSPEGKETVEGQLFLKSDEQTRNDFNALLGELIEKIIAAKESSASDESLKAALNTLYKDYDGVKKPYKGKAVEWYSHKGMKEVINVVPIISGIISMVVPSGSDAIEKLYAYDSPFPIQGSEMCFLISDAYQIFMMKMLPFLSDLIQVFTKPSSGGNLPVSNLKYMLDNMASSVGDRKDVTVGDKIVMCMVVDIVDMTLNGIVKYADEHTGSGAERFDDLNTEWILANCGSELDRIYSELEVIGYIYDTNIDVGAITGMMLGD